MARLRGRVGPFGGMSFAGIGSYSLMFCALTLAGSERRGQARVPDGARTEGTVAEIRQNPLRRVESGEQGRMLDPLDIPARLDELRTLKDGWLDGKGLAPSAAGLDWLAAAFEQHYPDDLALPRLFPTAEGGIQAEWSVETWEISLEIDIQRRIAEWHSLDVQSGADAERPLNLDCSEDWQWLAGEIRRGAGPVA